MKQRLLITGANGQLGNEFRELEASSEHLFTFIDLEDADLTSMEDTRRIIRETGPDYIINCAAYTAVDQAESEPEKAERVNAGIPRNILDAVNSMKTGSPPDNGKPGSHTRSGDPGNPVDPGNPSDPGSPSDPADSVKPGIIHISTDYVFGGDTPVPLKETDTPDPRGAYARSKLSGEKALENDPCTMIIRTSWLYSSHGKNFVKTMIRMLVEKDSLGVVYDQTGSPTYAADLAKAILQIVDRSAQPGMQFPAGIYHYANEGVTTWFDLVMAIREQMESGCCIHPIETKDYPLPAPRPKYSVLNTEKIKKQFDLGIPYWRVSLLNCLNKIHSEKK